MRQPPSAGARVTRSPGPSGYPRIGRDGLTVDRRRHAVVELQPGSGDGVLQPQRGRRQPRRRGPLAQRADHVDRDGRPRVDPGLLVLGRRVDVAQGVEVRVERVEPLAAAELVLVEEARAGAGQQDAQPALPIGQEPVGERADVDAIRRPQRLAMAVRDRDGGVVLAPERSEDGADEARMQERRIDRRRERDVRAPAQRAESDGQSLQRTGALGGVEGDLDAGGQRRQLLARRGDRDHRPILDRARQHPGDPRGERLAVPVQRGLGAAHARRAPAHEEDRAGPHAAGA